MGDTKIEWAEKSWNPISGCSAISPGCMNCYARRIAKRLAAMGVAGYSKQTPFAVTFHENKLEEPLHWMKRRMVFVCSMGDPCHPVVSPEWQDKIFAVMARTPQHVYQVLTKRADALHSLMIDDGFEDRVRQQLDAPLAEWPLPNVWLGVTVENQSCANKRIPLLRDTPAALRFLSVEPLLEAITLDLDGIDWVIVGAESGPARRTCRHAWVREVVRHCRHSGVPVFVKQLENNGCIQHDPLAWPEDLRVREYPRETSKCGGHT